MKGDWDKEPIVIKEWEDWDPKSIEKEIISLGINISKNEFDFTFEKLQHWNEQIERECANLKTDRWTLRKMTKYSLSGNFPTWIISDVNHIDQEVYLLRDLKMYKKVLRAYNTAENKHYRELTDEEWEKEHKQMLTLLNEYGYCPETTADLERGAKIRYHLKRKQEAA